MLLIPGKAVGTGITVNDVLLSLLMGALRQHCVNVNTKNNRGSAEIADKQACVWVALKKLEDPKDIKWENTLGAVYLKLRLNEAHPIERLRGVHEDMNKLKHSPEPFVARALMQLFGYMPPFLRYEVLVRDAVGR